MEAYCEEPAKMNPWTQNLNEIIQQRKVDSEEIEKLSIKFTNLVELLESNRSESNGNFKDAEAGDEESEMEKEDKRGRKKAVRAITWKCSHPIITKPDLKKGDPIVVLEKLSLETIKKYGNISLMNHSDIETGKVDLDSAKPFSCSEPRKNNELLRSALVHLHKTRSPSAKLRKLRMDTARKYSYISMLNKVRKSKVELGEIDLSHEKQNSGVDSFEEKKKGKDGQFIEFTKPASNDVIKTNMKEKEIMATIKCFNSKDEKLPKSLDVEKSNADVRLGKSGLDDKRHSKTDSAVKKFPEIVQSVKRIPSTCSATTSGCSLHKNEKLLVSIDLKKLNVLDILKALDNKNEKRHSKMTSCKENHEETVKKIKHGLHSEKERSFEVRKKDITYLNSNHKEPLNPVDKSSKLSKKKCSDENSLNTDQIAKLAIKLDSIPEKQKFDKKYDSKTSEKLEENNNVRCNSIIRKAIEENGKSDSMISECVNGCGNHSGKNPDPIEENLRQLFEEGNSKRENSNKSDDLLSTSAKRLKENNEKVETPIRSNEKGGVKICDVLRKRSAEVIEKFSSSRENSKRAKHDLDSLTRRTVEVEKETTLVCSKPKNGGLEIVTHSKSDNSISLIENRVLYSENSNAKCNFCDENSSKLFQSGKKLKEVKEADSSTGETKFLEKEKEECNNFREAEDVHCSDDDDVQLLLYFKKNNTTFKLDLRSSEILEKLVTMNLLKVCPAPKVSKENLDAVKVKTVDNASKLLTEHQSG